MLVLSRKNGEVVVVGGSAGFDQCVKVKVLAIHGDRVKLGFETDSTVPIHRLEVWERVRAADAQRDALM